MVELYMNNLLIITIKKVSSGGTATISRSDLGDDEIVRFTEKVLLYGVSISFLLRLHRWKILMLESFKHSYVNKWLNLKTKSSKVSLT